MKERKVYSLHIAGYSLRLVLSLLLVVGSLSLFSQASSPYSRYGLGYINSTVFSANRAMGGVAAPYASLAFINYTNPASYASLTRTTIELGMNVEGASVNLKDSTYKSTQAGISHFALAFAPNPYGKKQGWGVSLGLLPFSTTNYTFIQNFNDSTLGNFRQIYQGKGSLYQAYVGGAYKVKGFSVGANVGFLFGKVDYQKTITFPDTAYSFSTRNTTSMNVRSFIYTVGVQYQHIIYHNTETPDPRTDIFVTAGAYGSGGMKMDAKVSSNWDRFIVDPTYGIITVDTVSATFNQKAKVNLPANMGAGVMFGNERFWMVGFDFKYMNWQKYTSPLNNGGLGDSWRFSFGAQIIPKSDEADKKKYLSTVQYRAGVYVGKSEIRYGGKQLNEVGGTVGLGIPFKKVAFLNLTGDFGNRGINDATAIRETYYRVTFGITLTDIWFIKRKYD
ncbi:MAG: hypothetical protein KA149_04705 [Chitinophagales bacterium]|nr:hypothetical protein [Chitinophagales bacterium]